MKNTKLSFALFFKWIFRAILLVLFIYYSIVKVGNNANYIINILIIFVTSFIPDITLNLFKVKMSNLPDFLLQFFIFLALLLGRMYNMYSILPWWDLFLHFASGVLLGFLALAILKPLIGESNLKILPPLFIGIYILLFTISGAALWEFWEFAGDQLFGFDSQLNSLMDTMTDMIVGSLSGVILSIMGFLHMKNGSFKFLDEFINAVTKLHK
ncbi:hypothetical protein GCM10008908_13390 [Clostridium subterminale]|uniref:Membrane-spanning protein n=1 Tax=Clostridium subterminale TaxID=1550 RepID=A0ABP3VZ90_CLOSU